MEEKHVSENRIVSVPGAYSIFGTKENTKPPEINALPLDSVIGDFQILAVNEHPSEYMVTLAPVLASGDWWKFYENGLLDIYCDGDMPNYNTYSYRAPWYKYREQITSVTIGDSVTSVGECTFYGYNAITSVTIGDGVTRIRDWAFSLCKALTSVTIGDSVTSIGQYAFYVCNALTSVTIPNSVTNIMDAAFSWCEALSSITIGDGVTSIGDSAFYKCRALTDVYYAGSQEQWRAISIKVNNYDLGSATIHYNSTGPT